MTWRHDDRRYGGGLKKPDARARRTVSNSVLMMLSRCVTDRTNLPHETGVLLTLGRSACSPSATIWWSKRIAISCTAPGEGMATERGLIDGDCRPHQLENYGSRRCTRAGQELIKLCRWTASLQVDEQHPIVTFEQGAIHLPPQPLARTCPDK